MAELGAWPLGLCVAVSKSVAVRASVSPLLPTARAVIPEAIVGALLELLGFWCTCVFVELRTPGPSVRWDFWREDAKA